MSPRSVTLLVGAIATVNVIMISAFLGARPASGAGPGVVITSPLADDGSVRTSATIVSAANPSVATQSPFDLENQTIPSGAGVSAQPADPIKVTAYSFHTADSDLLVTFVMDVSSEFASVFPRANRSQGHSITHCRQTS